jgi:glycerol kinase
LKEKRWPISPELLCTIPGQTLQIQALSCCINLFCMRYIGALDQGTSSTRFFIFDQQGNAVGFAQREHTQIFPHPGWVEHDPVEVMENVKLVTAEAMIKAGLTAADIAALGITNQRETTVVWNRRTGKPYANAIVWQDVRTEGLVDGLTEKYGLQGWQNSTGLPFATYFSALKLKWLLDQDSNLRADAQNGDALFGNMDAWILWNLTGEHKTDLTNASRTQLLNLHTLDWDTQILNELGIPRSTLPSIHPSASYFGTITEGSFRNLNIMGMAGDQQAALFGQTCFGVGEAKNTYGTGCFMLMNTGSQKIFSRKGLLTTIAYQLAGQEPVFALEGSVSVAGALVRWLRDNLGIIGHSDEVEGLATRVADNGDVYFVPAFSGLFAPHWQSRARGTIAGLSGYATKSHIARAALEAAAYQTKDVLMAMESDSGIPTRVLKVDGGMTANQFLMQFQADLLQVPVHLPFTQETTALGAAYLAGLSAGYWKGQDSLVANHRIGMEWLPRAENEGQMNKQYERWQKAVQRSMDWVD